MKKMLSALELGANMSIKVHFLFSHLDRLLGNLGDYSEKQGERHQKYGRKGLSSQCQVKWDEHMMADYYWNLMRNCPKVPHKRN